jgi:hypothetical protein
MVFSSFTNEVGTRVQTRYVNDYIVEYGYRDWFTPADFYGPDVTERYYATVTTEISRKPAVLHGDFHTPLGYWRSGTKATTDEPVVVSTARIISDRPVQWRDEVTLISTIYNMVEIDVPGGGGSGQNCFDEAQNDALRGLQANYSGMGANFAQSRKTVDEMSKVALKVGSLIKALKKGDFGSLERQLKNLTRVTQKTNQKDIAGLWLSYIYGWKPLLQDLHSLQQAVHEDMLAPPRLKSTGKGIESYTWENSSWSDSKWKKRGTRFHSAVCVLFAKVSNPMSYQLAQAGLLNPAAIAWELVPFSFIFDWFIPIGKTLEACTATVGLEPDGGFVSLKSDLTSSYSLRKQWTEQPSPGFISSVKEPGSYVIVSYSFVRTALSAFPWPKLYADQTPYSTTRATNALALFRQLT